MIGAPTRRRCIWSRLSLGECGAFVRATTGRLVLAQEAVADKSNEINAIPVLIARLAESGGLNGALVSVDAVATNAAIATAIRQAGADYLLAVKANRPTLRAEVESFYEESPPGAADVDVDLDKGHGRTEQRIVTVAREVDRRSGDRRFPGELRVPAVAMIVKVQSRAELKDRGRFETRYCISSATLTAKRAADAIRGRWGVANPLHWVLDVAFKEDQSRLRKGHGAKNIAVVRPFAVNLVRSAKDEPGIELRRKLAGRDPKYLAALASYRLGALRLGRRA